MSWYILLVDGINETYMCCFITSSKLVYAH